MTMERQTEEKRIDAANFFADSYQRAFAHAVDGANRSQATAILQLFALATGAIGLLSVHLTRIEASDQRTFVVASIVGFFLSIVFGLLQLEEDKKYFMKSADFFKQVHMKFAMYEYTGDEDGVKEALQDVFERAPSRASERFYYAQAVTFLLAAVLFFVPYLILTK